MMLSKALHINKLYDIYSEFLTPRQREVFEYYYHDDLSYQEIADVLSVSKAAIYDNISKTSVILESHEEKLHLLALIQDLEALEDTVVQAILKKHTPGGHYE